MNLKANSSFRAGDFARLEAIIVPKLIAGITNATQIVYDESQALVPVDTGFLKESGSQAVEWSGKQVVGTVEYSSGHAAYNEFGTGQRGEASGNSAPGINYDPNWPGMPGSPYLRPAIDSTRQQVLEAIKAEL